MEHVITLHTLTDFSMLLDTLWIVYNSFKKVQNSAKCIKYWSNSFWTVQCRNVTYYAFNRSICNKELYIQTIYFTKTFLKTYLQVDNVFPTCFLFD